MYSKKLKEGMYRAVLILDTSSGRELPFNFQVHYKGKTPQLIIINAEERIVVDEIELKKDSLFFKMPAFDTEFRCRIKGHEIEGVWINHYRNTMNKIPFKAWYGESRRFLNVPGKADPVFEGKWEVTFSPDSPGSAKAIGVFKHTEQTNYVTGTFLTETGDYRYLDGMQTGTKLMLSCFDGSHAYLFEAEIKNEIIQGMFYSGAHFAEPWTGRRNENFVLRDAEEITVVKNKEQTIDFSFDDLNGTRVALSDQRFVGKPVIIQLMGSWCPNCMDESRYFSQLYTIYNKTGLEIIALAFEKTQDPEKARQLLLRMKNRLNIEYPILITQLTGKEKATGVFPGISAISAFPTSIYLDKQHRVVKIHTGFSGPATEKEYLIYKERTEQYINKLLQE